MHLHCQEFGEGAPVILLHGLLGSHQNLLPQGRFLARHSRVFSPDLRNHGASPHSVEFDYDVMANDLMELIRHRKLCRVTLIGHSMGGKVAMRFAQRNPERVSNLVVVDMSPRRYELVHLQMLDTMLAFDLKQFSTRAEIDTSLAAAVPNKSVRQFLLKNLGRDNEGALYWKPNLRAIRANYSNLAGALPADAVFTGSTLFVRGGGSDHIVDSDMKLILELFPQATLETIPEAGHWVHADAPEVFNGILERFLHSDSRKGRGSTCPITRTAP